MTSATATADAELAIGRLSEMCADLRACAVLDANGSVLAQSADNDWGAVSARLWEALDQDGGPRASQIHVGTETGELFAIRSAGIAVLALTDRFTLASLMFCDLRSVLRDLEAASGGAGGPGSEVGAA